MTQDVEGGVKPKSIQSSVSKFYGERKKKTTIRKYHAYTNNNVCAWKGEHKENPQKL